MQQSSGNCVALEIHRRWQDLDSQVRVQYEARAEQLQALYRVQIRDYRQRGRYRAFASSIAPSPPHVEATVLQDESMPEMSQVQLHKLIDMAVEQFSATTDLPWC